MQRRKMSLLVVVLCGMIALAACGADNAGSTGGARATVAPTTAGGGAAPAGGASGGAASTVSVVGSDFKFVLDKTSVPAGNVTFNFKNEGPTQHNFVLMVGGKEQASMLIEAGKSASFTANLPKGTYKYICNVAGHEQLGMVGMFTTTYSFSKRKTRRAQRR